MLIYLDESGDLGWNFDAPYRNGGSSRYLALAFLFLPKEHKKRPKALIRKMYEICRWKDEKKAASATMPQKIRFCSDAARMLQEYSGIKIDAIVANKINVQPHIREDSNKLYNYMTGLVVPDNVKDRKEVVFIPDQRSVKVNSGHSLCDYLQIKIWFDHNAATKIINNPCESHTNYNLQFTDWIAHCIWLHFEEGVSDPFFALQPHVHVRRLFF